MRVSIEYLSFFVVLVEGKEGRTFKSHKHYQTLDGEEYEDSQVKTFLHAELQKILTRKVERNPSSDQVPTKIGQFIVEPGHELSSNPNYNLFQRLRTAEGKEAFKNAGDDVVRSYLETSAVRGGALMVVQLRTDMQMDEPFVCVVKCDFENQIARISDEQNLITAVEMAISARNIKSIQYPHMPEEGMLEEWEIKVHQASHARYFEEFLKFVSYEQTLPEIINQRVMNEVQQYVEDKWPDANDLDRLQEEQDLELWSAGGTREIQEKWSPDQVDEAIEKLTQLKTDLELRMRIGNTTVKGLLAEFGQKIHLTQLGDRYAVIIEGDQLLFDDKGYSPVELLQPESFELLSNRLLNQSK